MKKPSCKSLRNYFKFPWGEHIAYTHDGIMKIGRRKREYMKLQL